MSPIDLDLIVEGLQMHFGLGWIATFIGIFLMNLILLAHWALTAWGKNYRLKTFIGLLINVALATPFFVYFVQFFGGHSHADYMVPLSYFAGFYLCFSVYATIVFLVRDLFRTLRFRTKERKLRAGDRSIPKEKLYIVLAMKPRFSVGVAVICAAIAFTAFIAPKNIIATHYDLELDERSSTLSSLRIAFIADAHIGAAVREDEIDKIVSLTNEAEPDIILFGGDIFDEGTPDALKTYASDAFSKLESKYGSYFILGNHDDYLGNTEEILSLVEDAGIQMMLNDVVLIDGAFYLIGREDYPQRRVSLSELEAQVTENLPVILLDHKPLVSESRLTDVTSLQLSGHTHDGQIFPFHILDPFGVFSLNYGLYQKGNMQLIVTSGVGEYAAPVRLGSPAEIVIVDITFTG